MINEIWKDVPNYEGLYQVSNLGGIKSLKRNGARGGLLKGEIDEWGYIRVCLSKENHTKKYKLHRLVLNAFLGGETPLLQVNHKDGNKRNNKLENLEWCTPSYNTIHSYLHNLNKTKGKTIIITSKENGKVEKYRSMRDASISMGYNKGYLFIKIKKNVFENEKYKWEYANE